MTAAILGILAALIPVVAMLIRRHLAREDDPKTIHDAKREQLAREILRNDETGANQSLDDDLESIRLRPLQSDQRGSNSPPTPSR